MASSKKNMGKKQRDRLKKAQAKRHAAAAAPTAAPAPAPVPFYVPAAAIPNNGQASSSSSSSSTINNSNDSVPELDPNAYTRVHRISNMVGMTAFVKEVVGVDCKGRKFRAMMGKESHMDLLTHRLYEENSLQERLDMISAEFNALQGRILGVGRDPRTTADLECHLEAVQGTALDMVLQSHGGIISTSGGQLAVYNGSSYRSALKLILARENVHYNFVNVQGDHTLMQQLNNIEQGLRMLSQKVVQESGGYMMDLDVPSGNGGSFA